VSYPPRYHSENDLHYLTTRTYRRTPVFSLGRGQAGGSFFWKASRSSQWIGCRDDRHKRPAARDRRLDKTRICASPVVGEAVNWRVAQILIFKVCVQRS
jgi:hypothetical protein